VLAGKTIVLGVTGSIAAYKAAEIISKLKKKRAQVKVIMTRAATEFITPLTLQTLSQNPVGVEQFAEPKSWEVEHISLAELGDIFLLAPASANLIGKLAAGIADDLLTSTIMAAAAPVVIAPAMNVRMYENPITQDNIAKLNRLGYHFIEPAFGMLACGYEGKGRLAEIETIVDQVERILLKNKDLRGIKIVVTAGPTREPVDPVRFLSNRSTGKMGYALAQQAAQRGAEVVLVSGPTSLSAPAGLKIIKVQTAREMRDAVFSHLPDSQVIIKAAAVADFRPKFVFEQKVKKGSELEEWQIELERNPDILYELGQHKGDRVLVGFAAETQDLLNNALAKIKKKNLDLIVANDLTLEGAGFGTDTNIVKIISRTGEVEEPPQMSKAALANKILDKIKLIAASSSNT